LLWQRWPSRRPHLRLGLPEERPRDLQGPAVLVPVARLRLLRLAREAAGVTRGRGAARLLQAGSRTSGSAARHRHTAVSRSEAHLPGELGFGSSAPPKSASSLVPSAPRRPGGTSSPAAPGASLGSSSSAPSSSSSRARDPWPAIGGFSSRCDLQTGTRDQMSWRAVRSRP